VSDVLEVVAPRLLGPAVMFAAAIIVKGYADVGDGFSAGVIVALAIALRYITLGTERAERGLPILRRAEELGKSARSRAGEQEPWHPLSAREFEVARLVAQGMTNAEIAGELFLSPKTVSAHIEHMLDKLGVARRAEIAAWTSTVNAPARSDDPRAVAPGAHGRR